MQKRHRLKKLKMLVANLLVALLVAQPLLPMADWTLAETTGGETVVEMTSAPGDPGETGQDSLASTEPSGISDTSGQESTPPSDPTPGGEAPTGEPDPSPSGEAPTAEPDPSPSGEAPTGEPDSSPSGEAPTAEPDPSPSGEAPTAEPDPSPSGEAPTVEPDPTPGEGEEGEPEEPEVPARDPMALDTLVSVHLYDGDGNELNESAMLPAPGALVRVALGWALSTEQREALVPGDYTVVQLPDMLAFAADGAGLLESAGAAVGAWSLDAAKRELKWTFDEHAAAADVHGSIPMSATLHTAVSEDPSPVVFVFAVRGGGQRTVSALPYVEPLEELETPRDPVAVDAIRAIEVVVHAQEPDDAALESLESDASLSEESPPAGEEQQAEEPAAPILQEMRADVTISWAIAEGQRTDLRAGDYTLVHLPEELISLIDASGALGGAEGTIGAWELSAASRTLRLTYDENAALSDAQGTVAFACQIDVQALEDGQLDALTFTVEGGQSHIVPIALPASQGLLAAALAPLRAPMEVDGIIQSITLKKDGQEIGETGNLTPLTPGGNISIDLTWAISEEQRQQMIAGDYVVIKLPDEFEIFGDLVDKPLSGTGGPFGTWSLTAATHELKLVFNEAAVTLSNVSGSVNISSSFDLKELDNKTKVDITFVVNGEYVVTIPIKLAPEGVTNPVAKSGDAGINASKVTWTVDVNKTLEPLTGATVTDTLGLGQKLLGGSIKVYELSVSLDGKSVTQGKDVTGAYEGSISASDGGFTLNLGTIDTAYRIVYEAEITEMGATSLSNTAWLGTASATANVDVTRLANMAKSGVAKPVYNAKSLEWRVDVNLGERALTKPVVTDDLPDGVTFKNGTLRIVKLSINPGDGTISETGVDVTSSFTADTTGDPITVTANDSVNYAYRIYYETDITAEGKALGSFENSAGLSDPSGASGSASHTLTTQRGTDLSKSSPNGVYFDYANKYIDWRIDVNTAEEAVNGLVKDTIGAGHELVTDSVKVYELSVSDTGVLQRGTQVYPSITETASQFTVDLGSITTAYRIEYRTRVTDVNATKFGNTAGVGIGTEKEVAVNNPISHTFTKTGKGVDHANQELSWEIVIKPLKEEITGLVLTDTFSPGMTLKDGSLSISPAATYTLQKLTKAADGKEGYVLTFTQGLKDKDYTITYKTKLDYTLNEQGVIPENYTNTAKFAWTGVTPGSAEKTATQKVTVPTANNGEKSGVLDRENGRITWTILVNHLSKQLSNVVVTDTVGEEDYQRIVQGSVNVETYTVNAGGAVTNPTQVSASVTYTDDNHFTVSLGNITKPHRITYQTELTGLKKNKYNNTANVNGIDYSASVTYANHDTYVSKSSVNYKNGDAYVSWTVTLNQALAQIQNAVVTDTIGSGHVLDQSSVVVERYANGQWSTASNYTLAVQPPNLTTRKQIFTISFTETISHMYRIRYRTNITTTVDGQELSNAVHVKGEGQETVKTTESGSQKIRITDGSGTGQGELGSLKIIKRDIHGAAVSGAGFSLYRGTTFIGEGVTGDDGTLMISDLNYGTYTIREANPPDGYQVAPADENITVVISAATLNNGLIEKTIVNYPLSSLKIVKVDSADSTVKLPGVSFLLKGGPNNFSQVLTTDAKGEAEVTGLLFGTYQLTETDPPFGYYPRPAPIGIALNTGNLTYTYTVTNELVIGSVEVIKKDSVNGDVKLAGAEFLLEGPDGFVPQTLTTDSAGYASLGGLLAGDYTLTETNPPDGYHPQSVERKFTVGPQAGKQNYEFEIENEVKGSLEITKVDSVHKNLGLKGAEFELKGPKGYLEMLITDENGEVLVEGLYPGEYTLTEVTAPDDYHMPTETVRTFIVGPGDNAEENGYKQAHAYTIENEIKGSLKITKVDSVDPILRLKGAQFLLTGGPDGFEDQVLTTDENGEVLVEGLYPGTYTLTETLQPTNYHPPKPTEKTRTFTVEADATKSGKNLHEYSFTIKNDIIGSFKLTKVDWNIPGWRLANAKFLLTGPNGFAQTLLTDWQGEASVQGLYPGRYVVREIEAPLGYHLRTETWTFDVGPGQGKQHYTYTIDNVRITAALRIIKEDKRTPERRLAGAVFQLTSVQDPAFKQLLTTDAWGEAVITGLPLGEYVLTEVQAPKGYVLDKTPTRVLFTVNSYEATIRIPNTRLGGRLPRTGEDSPAPYYIGGMAILMLGLALLMWRPKRKPA